MPLEIVLPADAEPLIIRRIPEYFAHAICNDLPSGTQSKEHPSALHSLKWYEVTKAHQGELKKAITHGELIPMSPLTHLPEPSAIGEHLKNCYVTLDNLSEYAARRGFVVRVAPPETAAPPVSVVMPDPKSPDWNFWRHMPHAKVWEACALSLNINPDSMKHSPHAWMAGADSNPIFESCSFPTVEVKDLFDKRIRLCSANMYLPPRSEINLNDFAEWAVSKMGWDKLPTEFVELMQQPAKPLAPEIDAASSGAPGQAAPPEMATVQPARGITKQQVMNAFEGLLFDHEHWGRNLASPPKWLIDCRVAKGNKKTSALWSPVLIAAALSSKNIAMKKLDAVFVGLSDWLDEWSEVSGTFR